MALDEELAKFEARQTLDPISTRVFIDDLSADYGMAPSAVSVLDSPETREASDVESDDSFDWEEDSGDERYWASRLQQVPVMAKERYAPCASEIEAGVIAEAILMKEWTLESAATEEELEQIMIQGRRALAEMFEGNLRLALYWAVRSARGDHDLAQDFFQEGCIGLLRAIKGWDAQRGYQFSTYASWHVRQSIQRAATGGASRTPVQIPVHAYDAVLASERHGSALSRSGEIALPWMQGVISWEVLVEQLPDLESQLDASLLDELLDRLTIESEIQRFFSVLDEREADVLRERFGFGGREQKTLDAIGRDMGLSRERVRQIQSGALGKMRRLV